MTNALLIDVQNLKKLSITLNKAGVDDEIIMLAIRDCQEQIIEPIIGSNFLNKLLSDVNAGNMLLSYQQFVIDFLWPLYIHGVTYIIASNLLFRLSRTSVVKDSNANSTAVEMGDLNYIKENENWALDGWKTKVTKHLLLNASLFPEYISLNYEDTPPDQLKENYGFYYNEDDWC